MTNHSTTPWQERFELKTCTAAKIEKAIPATYAGVAVIYTAGSGTVDEKVYLVVESRAGSLRAQCVKRLTTAKLPPVEELTVAFKAAKLPGKTREDLDAVCREQVIFGAQLRRELRPAMR
ncbi:MAG: hypothetical protein ACAH89_03060 [Rariglobus sp.]|nr:hypothetical protein [Rariglobus sp.]